jgi:predicted transcriptional regulator
MAIKDDLLDSILNEPPLNRAPSLAILPKEKPNTNQTQTTHKPNTNQTQTEHSVAIKNTYQTQTKHKPNTKLNTQKTQSTHKLDTNLTQTEHISTLIGHQRNLLLFIFEACKKSRSHITEPLTIIHISTALEMRLTSIKTSISRLCEKGFISINSFKNGRGGWTVYEISDSVYKELLQMETQHKLHTNYTQSRDKLNTKLNTQPNTSPPSSSSNLINTTTNELSEDWNFDITPYEKFGFGKNQLKQIASLGILSAREVEQSLIEFKYDDDNNTLPNIKKGIIAFLVGSFRNGRVYLSEKYQTEQRALNKLMEDRAENKRKLQHEANFLIWESKLTDDERNNIVKIMHSKLRNEYNLYGLKGEGVKSWFFHHYAQSLEKK